VILADIPGRTSGFPARRAQIYLPPAWFVSPRPHLPVIELLHGTPGGPADWTRAADADVTAERWAANHGGLAPIIVMPDVNGSFWADTECVNGTAGNAETYLTQDVPTWAIAHLHAAPARGSWAIAGASEGGYCALMLALRHPTRYSTFADFSGLSRPTASGGALSLVRGSRTQLDAYQPAKLLSRYQGPALAGWFSVGGSDGGTTRAVVNMASKAKAHGISTRLTVMPGAHHTWRVWRSAYADAWPWLAIQLGATSPPSRTTQLVAKHRLLRPVVRVDTDPPRAG
jgi:S-formylglutathione hydrolase FrmB